MSRLLFSRIKFFCLCFLLQINHKNDSKYYYFFFAFSVSGSWHDGERPNSHVNLWHSVRGPVSSVLLHQAANHGSLSQAYVCQLPNHLYLIPVLTFYLVWKWHKLSSVHWKSGQLIMHRHHAYDIKGTSFHFCGPCLRCLGTSLKNYKSDNLFWKIFINKYFCGFYFFSSKCDMLFDYIFWAKKKKFM